MNESLTELIQRSFARYVRVKPEGLQLEDGRILPSMCVQLQSFQSARTYYEDKRPACRSLDAVRSLDQTRRCAECKLRMKCTPQIYIEMLYDRVPLRMLLAYTSARNFMLFISTLKRKNIALHAALIVVAVRHRGRWGEVYFRLNSSKP